MAARNISYRVLTPSYVGKAVDCIAASFAEDPFSRVCGLQPSDWAAMSGMFVERAATKDISLIASRFLFNNQSKHELTDVPSFSS